MEVAVPYRADPLVAGKNAAEVARVLKAAGSGNLIYVKSGITQQSESFADLAAVYGLGEGESSGMVIDATKIVRIEAEELGHISCSDITMEVFRNIVIRAS